MRISILTALFLFSITLNAQTNTEVFLVDISKSDKKIELVNLQNISKNEGYDNQPSFFDANTILFASTRNRQTDIRRFTINNQETSWLTNSPMGSEYSPLKIPNKNALSAIRLDENGLQRLYEYDLVSGTSELLIDDLKVAYHVWYNPTIMVSSVIVDDQMDLVVTNLKNNTSQTVYKNINRSLHQIPNSGLISFISNENNSYSIKSLDPISGEILTIKALPIPIQDMCWLMENIILIPDGKTIAQLNTSDGNISILHTFKEDEINEISRMAVSANGKHLALVSEESPTVIIQKQVEAFNNRDLEIFTSCFADDVVVKNFPNDTLYTGNSKLKTSYRTFFNKNPKTHVEVIKRIKKGNVVIDHELVNIDGKEHHQVALYEITNGKIASMTFIQKTQNLPDAEAIIDQQLQAFNAKDINTFVKTFDLDIKAYNFPNDLYVNGQEQLQTTFKEFFTQTLDLHCDITNRIVIGNMVIDEEFLTVNGDNFTSVAIYEIQNGKISKMIIIR